MFYPTSGNGAPPAPRPGPRPRLRSANRHWWLRVAVATMALITALAVLLMGLIVTSPAVGGAPDRVRAILDAHGAPSVGNAIPSHVEDSLLATEDSRYYSDPALDPQGVARAVWGVITSNGNDGGATIELQLAKMLFVPGTSPAQQLRQVGVAFRLDQRFTKKKILGLYLDAAYFGDGAYGIVQASLHYFGVAPGNLSWSQASMLAGLVQAPTDYDPHGHLHLARQRQAHVLARLVATGKLTAGEATRIWSAPLDPVVPFYG